MIWKMNRTEVPTPFCQMLCTSSVVFFQRKALRKCRLQLTGFLFLPASPPTSFCSHRALIQLALALALGCREYFRTCNDEAQVGSGGTIWTYHKLQAFGSQ